MKTIKYFFFVALATVLMAADCSNKDAEFYNDVFATVPNLIAIETQTSYAVNDVLWINSNNFSRYIQELNLVNSLDAYKTTGGAQSFNFSYLIEKYVSADNWVLVSFGSNLINNKGKSIETGEFINATCVYNQTTENYDFRTGLKLTQAGNYRISFGYNSTSTTSVELRSDSVNNNLFLNIDSPITGIDSSGFYNFTVN